MNFTFLFGLLVGLTLGFVFMNLPPAITELMVAYGVSYTQISVLISSLLWSHALIQVPAGMIVDRLGMKRTMFFSLVCMCGGNALPSASQSIVLAICGRILTGVGTGLSFVTVMKMMALHAPAGRAGAYQSFFASFFSLGSIKAYLVVPYLLALGWRWIYLFPTLFCFILMAMLPVLSLTSQSNRTAPPLPLSRILSIRTGWTLGAYHALSYGAMLNLGNWVPSLLADAWGAVTASQVAWGGALVMLVSGFGRLAGGVVIPRFSPRGIANGTILILAFLFLAIFLVRSPVWLLSLALVTAWFASVNFGAFFHLASRAVTPDSLGTFLGLINLIANLGAITFTLLFGWLKDASGSFSWGFGVLSCLSLMALGIGRRSLQHSAGER
jgi:MFS family permease